MSEHGPKKSISEGSGNGYLLPARGVLQILVLRVDEVDRHEDRFAKDWVLLYQILQQDLVLLLIRFHPLPCSDNLHERRLCSHFSILSIRDIVFSVEEAGREAFNEVLRTDFLPKDLDEFLLLSQ